MKKKNILAAVAVTAAALVAITGCSSGAGAAGPSNGDKADVTIGVFNGWPEGEAASYLWKSILEKKGYSVKLKYADAGPVFAGVSTGDYDLALDGWLPTTHASYLKQYGDKIDDLGAWNSDAKLTVAVNKDAPIDSLDQLAKNAGKFDNKLVGIEPGAGLTKAVTDKVIPGYGLGKMKFVTSSTPAMLSELKSATSKGENIAVTLWRPQWAYDAFPIKDLKDPKGTLGSAESIHSLGSTSFSKDFPKLSGWVKGFKLDSKRLFSLENKMYNGTGDVKDYTPIVKKWIAANQAYVDGLTK
ncbi:glycine betaine ABC transporter substrate-binding protein [Lacisediminihabitans sp.]|uniref:glycine betaine ABC transporter substrate-binding protein n=1 Tax=Lacisediminihabitans sp. TaxID=2787631 RepID=UPI00374CF37B